MTLAKPVTAQNVPAYTKRWQAALPTRGMDLVPAGKWSTITSLAMKFSNIVKSGTGSREEIVDRVLTLKKIGPDVLNQVKLVWEFSSLKPVQIHGNVYPISLQGIGDPSCA